MGRGIHTMTDDEAKRSAAERWIRQQCSIHKCRWGEDGRIRHFCMREGKKK